MSKVTYIIHGSENEDQNVKKDKQKIIHQKSVRIIIIVNIATHITLVPIQINLLLCNRNSGTCYCLKFLS